VVAGELDFGDDAALVRYESDGDLDTGFGDQGIVVADRFTSESFNGVAIKPDGRIVAAGSASERFPAEDDFMVVRYNPEGSLDDGTPGDSTPLDSFGSGGITTTDTSPGQERPEDFREDLALRADGKIVVVGRNTSDTFTDMAVVRYHENGNLDTGFGEEGIVTADIPPQRRVRTGRRDTGRRQDRGRRPQHERLHRRVCAHPDQSIVPRSLPASSRSGTVCNASWAMQRCRLNGCVSEPR
jgi:uncharacterized delta-60 repeat protein